MSVSLLEKIKADAAVACAEIAKESDALVAKIKTRTEGELADIQALASIKLEKAKEQRTLVVTSKAKQAHNLAVQRAKREALDGVFDEAFAVLCQQSPEEYIAQYSALWQSSVPDTVAVLRVMAPVGKETETAKLLQNMSVTIEPTFVKTITAGVVVTTDKGVFDLTLDRRFSDAKPMLEMQVMDKLNS